MTPTDEAAKLARELAEADWPVDVYGEPASQKCAAKFLPILAAAFAERDEELTRLREAVKEVLDVMDECGLSSEIGPTYTPLYRLKMALQPKEPNNEAR